MPKGDLTERVITPMSEALVEAIDTHRFENRFPSRSQAIRALIENALAPQAHAGSVSTSSAPRGLSELIDEFFASDPRNVARFGYPPGTTAKQAAKLEITPQPKGTPLNAGYIADLKVCALRQLEIFEGDPNPAAIAICELLRPLTR
jgi:hypothetical protein